MNNYLSGEYHYPGNIQGVGPYGLTGSGGASEAPDLLNTFVANLIGFLTLIAGIYFFFVLIAGAISWIGAGGDSGKVEEAQKRITMGVIGLTIVIAAIFIAEILGDLVGFPAIIDPGGIISGLAP